MNAAEAPAPAVGANPFSLRAVLLLVGIGTALLLALLWMIGTGAGMGSSNDGGSHAGSKGLSGYAAVALYLEKRGYAVHTVRNEGGLARPGLLVLTPDAGADGREIEKVVAARRTIGPTLVITPKWRVESVQSGQRGARAGWVRIGGVELPEWRGFLDSLSVAVAPAPDGMPTWRGAGLSGQLPSRRAIVAGGGTGLVRLVAGPQDRITLAGFMDDGGSYPGLEAIAQDRVLHSGEARGRYPLVIVFEPDLLDNYGMARVENARLSEALVQAIGLRRGDTVAFDLTFNGLGRSDNLLTLAFTPPFLAATLCLLLAALIAAWRAFLRFGPPLRPERAIAFGKRALVANAAGLVRRSGRLHLLAGPYADRTRERLVRALALPRTLDADHAARAIDRACASRHPDGEPFTAIVARLRAARGPHDLVKAARDLHALERMLIR